MKQDHLQQQEDDFLFDNIKANQNEMFGIRQQPPISKA